MLMVLWLFDKAEDELEELTETFDDLKQLYSHLFIVNKFVIG